MKNLKKQILFIIILTGNCFHGYAQHVNLSNFFLIQNNKVVLLHWTIDSGPTCNGISIWRSSDSINYMEIGNIGGVCGNANSAIPYNFTDDNPTLNRINYYKIRLGYSQFSEVKTVHIKYTEPGKLIIKPNPSADNVVIEFNNESAAKYELTITNGTGNKVYIKDNLSNDKIELNTSGWSVGTYFVTLIKAGDEIFKEKLIITK